MADTDADAEVPCNVKELGVHNPSRSSFDEVDRIETQTAFLPLQYKYVGIFNVWTRNESSHGLNRFQKARPSNLCQ